MKQGKAEQLRDLVEELAKDAMAELVVELMKAAGDSANPTAAAILAKHDGRLADLAGRRASRRSNVQRFADIIRGRPPGKL